MRKVLQVHIMYVYVYTSHMKNSSLDKGSETRVFLSD